MVGLPGVPVVLEGPSHRGDVGEGRLFGQKAAEFQIGVHAVRYAPKELEDEPLPIDDRGVALLGGQRGGEQGSIGRPPQSSEGLRGQRAQRPRRPLEALAPGNGHQHGLPQWRLPPGFAQQPLGIRALHPGEHGLGGLLLHLRRVRADGNGQREDIGLWLALPVRHRDKDPRRHCRGRGKWHDLHQRDRANVARLPAEPAPRLQIPREEQFEGGFGLPLEDLLPRPSESNAWQRHGIVLISP